MGVVCENRPSQGAYHDEASGLKRLYDLDRPLADCGKTRFTGKTPETYRSMAADTTISQDAGKRPSSKAAASEEAKPTLRYVESLSDARTMLAAFFSILLERVETVDQLTQAARTPSIGGKGQPWQFL